MKKTLHFMATATWVTERVCREIPTITMARAAVTRKGSTNNGELVVSAHKKEHLDAAVDYILKHPIYKEHFVDRDKK